MAVSDYGAMTFAPALRATLIGLPRHAELDILVAPRAAGVVRRWVGQAGRSAPVRLHLAPAGLAFSLWTQDYFVARTDGVLLRPDCLPRFDDFPAAAVLGRRIAPRVQTARLSFEGGNLMACGPWLLIGGDTPDAAALDRTRAAVLLACRGHGLGEEQRAAGHLAPGWTETLRYRASAGSLQPLFHLDLFVAYAGIGGDGRLRFLVGCPRLGADLLGHPVQEHADADRFDQIAATLTERGALVIRNPLPLIWRDDVPAKRRIWYHLPVNNVLVQQTDGTGGDVWMPGFAEPPWEELAVVDAANIRIWQDLGFRVHRIPRMLGPAEKLGALHCMAKVIERDQPKADRGIDRGAGPSD